MRKHDVIHITGSSYVAIRSATPPELDRLTGIDNMQKNLVKIERAVFRV